MLQHNITGSNLNFYLSVCLIYSLRSEITSESILAIFIDIYANSYIFTTNY